MTKTAPGIACGEIRTIIGHLDTLTSIMVAIGEFMPESEVRPDWLGFFGNEVNRAIGRIEEAIESVE